MSCVQSTVDPPSDYAQVICAQIYYPYVFCAQNKKKKICQTGLELKISILILGFILLSTQDLINIGYVCRRQQQSIQSETNEFALHLAGKVNLNHASSGYQSIIKAYRPNRPCRQFGFLTTCRLLLIYCCLTKYLLQFTCLFLLNNVFLFRKVLNFWEQSFIYSAGFKANFLLVLRPIFKVWLLKKLILSVFRKLLLIFWWSFFKFKNYP